MAALIAVTAMRTITLASSELALFQYAQYDDPKTHIINELVSNVAQLASRCNGPPRHDEDILHAEHS